MRKSSGAFSINPFLCRIKTHFQSPCDFSDRYWIEGLHDGFIFRRILFFPRGAVTLIFALHFISPVW